MIRIIFWNFDKTPIYGAPLENTPENSELLFFYAVKACLEGRYLSATIVTYTGTTAPHSALIVDHQDGQNTTTPTTPSI